MSKAIWRLVVMSLVFLFDIEERKEHTDMRGVAIMFQFLKKGILVTPTEARILGQFTMEPRRDAVVPEGHIPVMCLQYGGAQSFVLPNNVFGPLVVMGPEACDSIYLHEQGHIESGHVKTVSRALYSQMVPGLTILQEVQASRWALENGALEPGVLVGALQTYIDRSFVLRQVNKIVPDLANRMLGTDAEPVPLDIAGSIPEESLECWEDEWYEAAGFDGWEGVKDQFMIQARQAIGHILD